MAGLLSQLFGSRRTLFPVQSLPSDGWCEAPGIGRMDLVWPWFALEEPAGLVDSFGRDVGTRPVLEIHAPRSDRDVVLVVWSTPGGAGFSAQGWANSVARLYGGRVGRDTPISIDGVVGQLAQITHDSDVTWRIIVPIRESHVQIEASAPQSHASAYWIQIESMLATWGWSV